MPTSGCSTIRLLPAQPDDAGQLTVVQALTFFDDRKRMPKEILAERPAPCGPPGCRSVAWNRKVIDHPASAVYKALDGDRIVGGLILFDQGSGTWNLGRIYVDPDRQNEGIGQSIIRQMFALHPKVKCWHLGTPEWAVRNHHFYKRMGFTLREITEADATLGWRSFEYENTLSAEDRSHL